MNITQWKTSLIREFYKIDRIAKTTRKFNSVVGKYQALYINKYEKVYDVLTREPQQ